MDIPKGARTAQPGSRSPLPAHRRRMLHRGHQLICGAGSGIADSRDVRQLLPVGFH